MADRPRLTITRARDTRPLLVTGVPRSGTTWLARVLASGPGCAMTGREPMNPHGRQYRLGGTIDAWTRLTRPTARQRAALDLAYRGWMPLVYSRYGYRQGVAALPWSKIVVKDPFAMLSIPAIVRTTGAVPVLVYRHPGAVLASYRRMGWRPDIAEVAPIVDLPDAPEADGPEHLAVDMARFWSALNATAVADLEEVGQSVIVAHEDVATAGMAGVRRLFAACGVDWDLETERRIAGAGSEGGSANSSKTLHDLNRDPAAVATSWRSHVSDQEVALLESVAGPTLAVLNARRIVLPGR